MECLRVKIQPAEESTKREMMAKLEDKLFAVINFSLGGFSVTSPQCHLNCRPIADLSFTMSKDMRRTEGLRIDMKILLIVYASTSL